MFLISRRFLLGVALLMQVFCCVWILLSEQQGFFALQKKYAHNKDLEIIILNKEKEIQKLKKEFVEWNNSLFLYEKYAREKMHMAEKDETIFFYDQETILL